MDEELFELAEELGKLLKGRGEKIAVAESCTGGMIAKIITDVPGSSEWFDCGFVTYSNSSKVQMLGVKQETLDNFGAVSFEIVREMLTGVFDNCKVDFAIAVTGIAGPGGGLNDKPVGTVFIGIGAKREISTIDKRNFKGDRLSIRQQTVKYVIDKVLKNFSGEENV